jgi:sugar phosphate isomerase/epimerase
VPERISIVTDEISPDLGECRAFLDEHDLHAVELRCVGGRRVPELEAGERETLLGWARAGDPRILAVSPGLFKCDRDDATAVRRHLREILPRSVELAHELDAPYLIAFSFENPASRPADRSAADAIARAAEACRSAGVTLLVENEPGFTASTPEEILALMRAVDHPNVFVNWDPLNSNVFDTDDLGAGLTKLFPHLRHVHVKNGVLAPGELLARCGRLRDGAIDWPAHLERLAWLGYGGYLGVETHFEPVMENSAEVLRELRDMLDEVGFEWSED